MALLGAGLLPPTPPVVLPVLSTALTPAAAAAVLTQAVDVALVVTLLSAALVLTDVVALVLVVPTGPPATSPVIPRPVAGLPALSSALVPAVLAAHVLVFAQLSRVSLAPSPSVAVARPATVRTAAVGPVGLPVLGVSVADALVIVGLVVLARPLRTGSPGPVPTVRGVSGPFLSVGHLLVLALSVTSAASPTALILL